MSKPAASTHKPAARSAAFGGGEYDQQLEVLLDVEEPVFGSGWHEHDVAGCHVDLLVADPDRGPAAQHVVELGLAVGLLFVLHPGGKQVDARRHARYAQELVIRLRGGAVVVEV